ncbi:LOW QUALITY PROTEIN: uncharacterized protein LOC124282627 [Haliotis rubra]|uniref:LOW QUALITY PROTEIN: uncharacterized protein LOC124282627 n=1 Tax=Haliotis rubra TaxID=36100 RepID=UPI001EE5421A|nr:LOW QUALITY PROTEIN: uncharacterized protein LOC124282627 [Haliotis rubra]
MRRCVVTKHLLCVRSTNVFGCCSRPCANLSFSLEAMDNLSFHEDHDVYLRRYDNEFALQVLVAILFLVVLMLTGLLGNTLVFYVYAFKFKHSTTRCYILALAVFDLISCVISIPVEITDMRFNYTFGQYGFCKIMRVFVTFSSMSSGAVLVAVAVDRYKKICRPFKRQTTPFVAKVAIMICSLVSFILSLPAAILYGSRTVTTDDVLVNGSDCSTADEYIKTPYPLIYNGVQFIVFISSTLTLVVLYSLIWRQVVRQQTFRRSVRAQQNRGRTLKIVVTQGNQSSETNNTSDDFLSSSTEGDANKAIKDTGCPRHSGTAMELTINPKLKERGCSSAMTPKSTTLSAGTKSKGLKSSSTNTSSPRQKGQKTTFMLFLITLVFVLSFLPHLGLMATRAANKHVFDDLRGAAMTAYNLFLRSYFINSASNPIVYSFCNEHFRRELYCLWRKMKCRVTTGLVLGIHRGQPSPMSGTNTTLSDHDVNVHLRRYDDIYAYKYLPAIVLVSVLMTTGIIGNSLVCCVYLVKFKSSTVKCFIVSLAVIDLINCVVSCPFDIADMRYRYTFGSYVIMCKTMRVFVTFTSVSSGLVLIPVAVDRYKKICRPFQKQMDIRTAKMAISACCTVGVVVGIPASVFYGPRTVTTDVAAINGSDCSTPDIYVGTPYPLIYNGFNLTIFLTTTVSLSVLYSLIWRRIRKQRNYRRKLKTQSRKCHSSSCVEADTGCVTKSRQEHETVYHEDNAAFVCELETSTERTSDVHNECASSCPADDIASEVPSEKEVENPVPTTSQRSNNASPERSDAAVKKTTLMLFLITLAFVLSFLPHLSLMAARAVNKEFFDKVDTPQFGAFYFFFKSYFINSAFNPIIYSFCNPRFRQELVAVVKRFSRIRQAS